MIHSKHFITHKKYRGEVFTTSPEDRPTIAQFCAHDPELLFEAAKGIQHQVDAIDINFGCPQKIAKRGHYGAFLLEEPELCWRLIKTLAEGLEIPVTAKIRLLPKLED